MGLRKWREKQKYDAQKCLQTLYNKRKLKEEGWQEYGIEYGVPELGCLTMFVSDSQKDKPWLAYREDIPRYFNVSGLYWKYTGIGKEQLARNNEQVQQNMEKVSMCGLLGPLAQWNNWQSQQQVYSGTLGSLCGAFEKGWHD